MRSQQSGWDDEDDAEFGDYGDDDFGDSSDEVTTVPCPTCGEQIYEETPRCPACGNYVSREDRFVSAYPLWVRVVGALLVFMIAGSFLRAFL